MGDCGSAGLRRAATASSGETALLLLTFFGGSGELSSSSCSEVVSGARDEEQTAVRSLDGDGSGKILGRSLKPTRRACIDYYGGLKIVRGSDQCRLAILRGCRICGGIVARKRMITVREMPSAGVTGPRASTRTAQPAILRQRREGNRFSVTDSHDYWSLVRCRSGAA